MAFIGAAIAAAASAAASAAAAAAAAVGSALAATAGAIGSGVGAAAGAVGLTTSQFVSVVGLGISSTVAGVQGAQQADMQRDTAAFNARTAENQAIELENANSREKADARMIASHQLSNQRAIAAAKGVSLDSDSSLSLFDTTLLQSQFQDERLDYNSNQRTKSLNQSADLARYEGNARAQNSRIGAANSIISGAGTVAANWYKATA